MLGKLLKYEIKATARIFLPLYGALIVFAILNRLFMWINISVTSLNIIRFLFMAGYVILIVGILVLTYVVMIQRFYKNLVKDEGYLMFTLPVRTWELIASKMIVSAMWMLLSTCMIFISVLTMCANAEVFRQMADAFRELNMMLKGVFSSVGLFYFEIILTGLVAVVSSVLMIYAAISLGSLFKNKLLGAFGAYVVIYLIGQLIMSLVILIINFVDPQIYQNLMASNILPQMIIWLILLLELIFGTGYFIASNYIFSKKLNLE